MFAASDENMMSCAGWDSCLFVDVERATDFQCGICQEVVRDAVQLQCGHLFCDLCIQRAFKYKLQCPSCRAVTLLSSAQPSEWHRRHVLSLVVQCPSDQKCPWRGPLRTLSAHLALSPLTFERTNQPQMPVRSPLMIINQQRPHSADSEMAQTARWDTASSSANRVSQEEEKMENKNDEEDEQQEAVGSDDSSDSSGADAVDAVDQVDERVSVSDVILRVGAQACQWAVVQCEWCSEKWVRSELPHHHSTCEARPLVCGDCGDTIVWREQEDHHQQMCREAWVPCPRECDSALVMRRGAIGQHEQVCPRQPVACPFALMGCQEIHPRETMSTHLSQNLIGHLIQHSLLVEYRLRRLEKEHERFANASGENKAALGSSDELPVPQDLGKSVV